MEVAWLHLSRARVHDGWVIGCGYKKESKDNKYFFDDVRKYIHLLEYITATFYKNCYEFFQAQLVLCSWIHNEYAFLHIFNFNR